MTGRVLTLAELELPEAIGDSLRPCRYCVGEHSLRCGTVPTQEYVEGPRCAAHTRAALAGEPEPGQGAYCPPALCLCGDLACPAAVRQRERAARYGSTA